MPRIAGIVLARMDSTRFPGKAMTVVGGVPLVEHCLDGVLRTKSFTPILTTSTRGVDRPLVEVARRRGILTYQGDLGDVYKRVCGCLRHHGIEIFARINGDSPFLQPGLLDAGLNLLQREECDLVTNLTPRTFPYGVSVEIFRSEVFLRAYEQLDCEEQREHITSFFYQHLDRFKIGTVAGEQDLTDIHLTVDTPEDKVTLERMLSYEPALFVQPLERLVKIYRKINKA